MINDKFQINFPLLPLSKLQAEYYCIDYLSYLSVLNHLASSDL